MSLVEEDDEWEVVNDEGFVYHRKKRPRFDLTATTSAPSIDPAVEEKNRKKRKKRALINVREKYENEIRRWELLSNTLRDLNLQTHNLEKGLDVSQQVVESPVKLPDSGRCKLLDEILSQVEAQEAMINNVSNLCEAAEALCDFQEERSKQYFLNLPVWASSPRELMSSLCDE